MNLKNDNKGQVTAGALGIIVAIGTALIAAAIVSLIYGNVLAAGGVVNATLNLVNATFIPLTVLVFAATGILAIILTLRARQ